MASSDLEPKNVFAAVSQLGIGGNDPFLDGEFAGGECRIFKLSFRDEADSLAVRIPHLDPDSNGHESTIATAQGEVRIYQILKEKGFPWAPRLCGASLTFDNPVKRPFIVLAWAEGRSLPAWNESFPPRPLRDRLLAQMASIQVSLIHHTSEDSKESDRREAGLASEYQD
jgi:hypothetical protein